MKKTMTGQKDIIDTAISTADFDTFITVLNAVDLAETLRGRGPFTVFAPTDKAFAKLPPGTIKELLKPMNRKKLIGILTCHLVAGKVMAADVVKLGEVRTVNGQTLKVTSEQEKVMVNSAMITKGNLSCSNGVIHGIDSVVLSKEQVSGTASIW